MAWDFLRSGSVLRSLPFHYHLDFLFPFSPVSLSLSICILFPAVFLSRGGTLAGWFQELFGLDSSRPLGCDCRFLMLTCKSSVQKFFQFWLLFSPWLRVFQWVPVASVEVLLFPSVRCPVASLSFFLHGSWYISVLQLLVICPFSIVFCSWCGVPCFLLANNWRFLVFIRALGRLKTCCPHSPIVPPVLRWSRALSCSEGWNVGETFLQSPPPAEIDEDVFPYSVLEPLFHLRESLQSRLCITSHGLSPDL